MAKVTVKGIDEAQKKLNAMIDDVTSRKAVRAVQAALMIFGAEAAAITPVDTTTLINSLYREVRVNGVIVTGRVGYSANYALYVHNASGKLKGKPRSSVSSFSTKSGKVAFASNRGNFWDPNGQPKFLTVGVSRGMTAADKAIKRELSL